MEIPIPLYVEGESPSTPPLSVQLTIHRWKDSLHLLTIGILQGNSTPRCMENWVPLLYSITFKKRELTCVTGPLDTSLPAQMIETDNRVLQATQQLSSEFPFNLDFNSGDTIGIGKVLGLSS
jgi:hypothetical protein